MMLFSVLGVIACVALLILGYKIIRERYTFLREVGKFPLVPEGEHPYKSPISDAPLYKKKFLHHKYSKGSSYDRAKLRKNRFQKNYVY